jgi:hypothetical protein
MFCKKEIFCVETLGYRPRNAHHIECAVPEIMYTHMWVSNTASQL